MEQNIKDIVRFYYKIKETPQFTRPSSDYEKCLKKINLTIYKLMITEYEKNIKPLLENEIRKAGKQNLLSNHSIEVEYVENEGYISFSRETKTHFFELRVFRYKHRLDGSTEQQELNNIRDEMERRKQLKKEHTEIDERYFFKSKGKFISTQLLDYERAKYKKNQASDIVTLNPFAFTDPDTDILEIKIVILNKLNNRKMTLAGSIFD